MPGGFRIGWISTGTTVSMIGHCGSGWRESISSGTRLRTLIGAAHAGCFSMALSLMLGEAGLTAEKIETHVDVTLEKIGQGFEITASHLSVIAVIPRADEAQFRQIANKAKTECPVSKLLKA